MVSPTRHWLLLGVLLSGGCARLASSFACDDSAACVLGGVQGTCESTGYCSFDDATCPSGRRYGVQAPESNACVVEGAVERDAPPIDGATDARPPVRATDGLMVLYTFSASTGAGADTSGVGAPLDLTIDPSVTLLDGALVLGSADPAAVSAPASKLVLEVENTDEVTVEAWVLPQADKTIETGVITGLLLSDTTRDVLLTEDRDRYLLTMRSYATTKAGGNANGDHYTAPGVVEPVITHLVATRTAAGLRTLWINGVTVSTMSQPGSLDAWSTYPIYVGNNTTATDDYEGRIELVAYYGRALTEAEVLANFAVGPDVGD